MMTFVLSFLLIALAIAGLAVGVMFGRKPLKGSCGGLNQMGMDGGCEICGGEPSRCENATKSQAERVN